MIAIEEHRSGARPAAPPTSQRDFVVPSRSEPVAEAVFTLADERLASLKRDIASLRARHAAMSDGGGRFIHHLARRIATIENAIGALRALAQAREGQSESGKTARRAELATLESSLREMRGYSGVSEIELAGVLASLMAAQGDAEALLVMIERVIVALQTEFASIRA